MKRHEKQVEPITGALTEQTAVHDLKGLHSVLDARIGNLTEEQQLDVKLASLRYKMEDYIKEDDNELKLAGHFLRLYLNSLNIRQNKFAEYLGLKPSNLSKLINGDRAINYDQALIFGDLFSVDPLLWIEVQAKNEFKRRTTERKTKHVKYSLKDLIS